MTQMRECEMMFMHLVAMSLVVSMHMTVSSKDYVNCVEPKHVALLMHSHLHPCTDLALH